MSDDPRKLLGIDIGGTKTAVVVGTSAGSVLLRRQFPSDAARGVNAMLADIEATARQLLTIHPDVAAVGAVVGGPVDAEAGMVCGPPNLPGWNAVPLADELQRRLGKPARIEHDAKAGALAEWLHGAGRGTHDMIFLTLGTGIGAGIVANGKLVRGVANLAGEIGHWRIAETGPHVYGKSGSLEGWASGAGLPALARWLYPDSLGSAGDAVTVATMAAGGNVAASDTIRQAAERLGGALALLVDLLAPEVIVLGNLAARLGSRFIDTSLQTLGAEALPALAGRCRVVASALGESIGDVAALSVANTALQ